MFITLLENLKNPTFMSPLGIFTQNGTYFERRHDYQHKDTQHNDTQHNNTQHNDS